MASLPLLPVLSRIPIETAPKGFHAWATSQPRTIAQLAKKSILWAFFLVRSAPLPRDYTVELYLATGYAIWRKTDGSLGRNDGPYWLSPNGYYDEFGYHRWPVGHVRSANDLSYKAVR